MKHYSERTALAAQITVEKVCRIRPQERVLIITNKDLFRHDAEEIACALADAACTVGAYVDLLYQSVKTSFDAADDNILNAIAKEPDVIFSVSVCKLGKDPQHIVSPLRKDGVLYDHIFDYLLYGKKSIRAVWMPGITTDIFERAVDIDYDELGNRCAKLSQMLTDAEKVHISTIHGTDIVIPIYGRSAFCDNGRFDKPGLGGNLPAGEVFISPVVGTGVGSGCNGTIVFDGSLGLENKDPLIRNLIPVTVEDGFISFIDNEVEGLYLKEIIVEAEKRAYQMEKSGMFASGQGAIYAKNARNIGELGIGLNPKARICGNMLEDEKVFSTCHFAIGANYDGDAPSLIHIDGVVRNPTINIISDTGVNHIIMKNGVLLL